MSRYKKLLEQALDELCVDTETGNVVHTGYMKKESIDDEATTKKGKSADDEATTKKGKAASETHKPKRATE